MRFYLETYGCTANQGNSDAFSSALMERGHLPSPLEKADLVIVNTCAVTEKTERKMVKRLSQLQGKKLIIAGCLPSAIPEAVRDMPCREVVGVLDRPAAIRIGDSFPPKSRDRGASSQPKNSAPSSTSRRDAPESAATASSDGLEGSF